jgi:hypothetical protein
MTIATITRKKAHHMPALKIVSTAPQLLRTTILKSRINKTLVMFIIKNFTVLPIISQLLYHFYYCSYMPGILMPAAFRSVINFSCNWYCVS